ncbi:MAG: hypothetical protein GXX79_10915 [Actinomycetales bacterium]|nr:hypothetical protein [Actinomycetales bacterium]
MESEGREAGEVALANLPLAEVRRRQRRVIAQLRDAEHWRRLVAARLDLAVAAVADIDDLVDIQEIAGGGPLPRRQPGGEATSADLDAVALQDHSSSSGSLREGNPTGEYRRIPLRDLLGIPRSEGRLPESALLLQLRDALRELDSYAGSLRSDVAATARVLANRIDDDDLADDT